MAIWIEQVPYEAIAEMRELFRNAAGCQIVRDSILQRGLADAFLISVDEERAGYGGVWNAHYPRRLMEFFLAESKRAWEDDAFLKLAKGSGAIEAEAQTNLEPMHALLKRHGHDAWTHKLLFGRPEETRLPNPGCEFRPAAADEAQFAGNQGSAEFVIEREGERVGSGGYLCHYNPPYADLFMDVRPAYRERGYGSFLVQEIKRRCLAAGRIPAARSDPANVASHRTLIRAGLPQVGELHVARLRSL